VTADYSAPAAAPRALLAALSGSLRRASHMLARALEQVFAWRGVAGSIRRLRGSGGERRRFGTGVHREVRVARGRVWQGALAASHHDRAQEQMALVDQSRADCVASELGTPDCDVGPEDCLSGGGRLDRTRARSVSARWIPSEASGNTRSSQLPARSRHSPRTLPAHRPRCSRSPRNTIVSYIRRPYR
jgi:hypothetical protein